MPTKSAADPNVKIPAAVLAIAARAAEAHAAAYPTENPGDPLAAPAELPAPAAAAEPPAAAPPVTSQGNPEVVTPPAPPTDDEPELDAAGWKHRYLSMKGRHASAAEAVRGLTERNKELQSLVTTLQTAPVTPVAPAPSSSASKLVTDEDVTNYGNDLLDVVARRAQEQLDPVVTELRNSVSKLEERLADNTKKTAQDGRAKMFSDLDTQLSTWREVNLRDDFLAWLQLPDTLSGAIRYELLQSAYGQNDTPRVLAFFKGFLSQEAAAAPAPIAEPGLQEPPINGGLKTPLQDLAAPGRARTTAPTSGPVEKPIITRAQITQFYTDVAAGKYRGRDEDRLANDNAIFEAEREGRIR